MLKDSLLILVSTALVNNFVLVKFLGLCPIMGVSKQISTAAGMSIATTFVLTLTAALSYLLHTYVLVPLQLEFLQIIVFIFTIASVVQLTEMILHRTNPLLHQVLGLYLPLITTNCAVLGLALLNVSEADSFFNALLYGLGSALGFALVLMIFASNRERLISDAIPKAFQGTPIAFITAGIMALAFMGFSGWVSA